MDRQVVSSWLRNVLTPYGDSSRSYSDIITVLDSLPSLSPRTELYISNLGETSLLIQLKGTIPITFKNNTYNIPIEIWIPKNYPRECPIAYVTPTKDINVRKTQHVELDGFVIGNEYVQNWTKKWQSKNLLSFIQACQESFGIQPPVYAKPKESSGSNGVGNRASPGPATPSPANQANSASAGPSSGPSKPPPPLPQSQVSQSPQPQSPAGPPRRPPKPGQNEKSASGDFYPGTNERNASGDYYQDGNSMRDPQRRQSSLSYNSERPDSYHQPQPPPHQYAGQQHQQAPPLGQHHVYSQQHPQQSPISPQSPLNQQQQQFHPQHHQHLQQGRQSGYPQQQAQYNVHHQQQAPPPPVVHNTHQHTQHGPNFQPPQQQPPVPPPPAPRDLLDADDGDENKQSVETTSSSTSGSAPPPVRPPNPELYRLHMALHAKMSARVSSMQSSLSTSNDHLRVLAKDLDAGPSAIEDELARLSAVREVCKTRAERLEATLESANRRRAELDARPQPPLGEIVLADSIVGEQLISLMSSDLALTDTLYHLSRALQSEQIDVDRYLKLVRLYGREQFLKRALARKIQLGLEGGH